MLGELGPESTESATELSGNRAPERIPTFSDGRRTAAGGGLVACRGLAAAESNEPERGPSNRPALCANMSETRPPRSLV